MLLLEPKPQPQPTTFWQWLLQGWGNFNFRTKLTILLMVGTAVPVIAVTQGLALISQGSARAALEETLRSQQFAFVNDYVLWLKKESEWQAHSLAETVQAVGIDLQKPTQVKLNTSLLQALVSEMMTSQDKSHPDSYKSFRIITTAEGKTVAQYIQIHADYRLGASPKSEEILQPVSLPKGIDLGDIPIIKNAVITGRSLNGIELLEGKFMQRLGLDKQASVSLQSQPTQGLPEPKQPVQSGTYPDVAQGSAGLVAIAVEPIKVQGLVVGFAVVGSLLNNYHSLVDTFGQNYNIDASVFARDLLVSTTPYGNSKTRAIGTRASREVAEVVLNQGKEFFGNSKIIGKDYLTAYSPLYDHQKELNPSGAKPVGMAFVGTPQAKVQQALRNIQLVGYGVGGAIALLAGLVAIPVAGSFSNPIRRLATAVQKLGQGELDTRVAVKGTDELSMLGSNINLMAEQIQDLLAQQSAEALRQTQEIAFGLDQLAEMSHSIRAVATNAQQAEAVVKQATQIVEAGDRAMNRTVDGIMAIRETFAETSIKVKRLGESSQKISQVVNLISAFADQTNLLALNAAIEAARAGEEGRGFAVVANQVRSLARQSQEAMAEIKSLLTEIQTETNVVVAAMEAGTVQVVNGTKQVDETQQSLNQITATSAEISALVSAIARSAVAQSQASEAVTQAMSNVVTK